MQWKRSLYNLLNRRGLRFILSCAATAKATVRAGKFCPVYNRGQAWVHHFPEAILVEPHIFLPTYAQLEDFSKDAWTWAYKPEKGNVVVAIGAGAGSEAVFFSRLVGANGSVFCIEAHPKIFRCLERTVAANSLRIDATAMEGNQHPAGTKIPKILQILNSSSHRYRFCPYCGHQDVDRERQKGIGRFAWLILMRPYRCATCHRSHLGFRF